MTKTASSRRLFSIPASATNQTSTFAPISGSDEAVIRHYVKQSPGELPSFPVYKLGPNTVGGKQNLFEFKPPTAPPPDPGDPAGTVTYWPTDNFFGRDRYAAFLNSNQDASDAGQYEIWLELFDKNGNLVDPSAGTFDFIVPEQVNPDQSVDARAATTAEIKTETIDGVVHKGFVFKLHIDNNHWWPSLRPTSRERPWPMSVVSCATIRTTARR